MAGRKVEYDITVDASQGVAGVKQFSRAVQQELKNVEGDFDDTATAGERVASVLSKMATEMDAELARAAQAADALKAALGEDLAGRMDVGQVIGGLQQMGLSFEDVTQDADKLAAALKQMDEVQLKGINNGLGGVSTKMGELEKSAGSSKSVLANMVGNSVQDLGALGGLAGSAGVAIGQMGEYMADAAGEGEKLGSVIKNFAGVGIPLAAIGVATKIISDHFAEIAATKAFNTDEVEGFADALAETDDHATAIAKHLEQVGKVEFRMSGDTKDVTENLAHLGLTVNQFAALVAGGLPKINKWRQTMLAAGAAAKDVDIVTLAASTKAVNFAAATELATVNLKVFGDEAENAANKTADAYARAGIELARIQAHFDEKAKDDAVRAALDASRQSAELQNKAAIVAANEKVLESVKELAEGTLAYNDALKQLDEGTAAVEGTVTAWQKITSQRFGLDTIAKNAEAAWDGLGEALKDANDHINLTFDLGTDRGRAINDAMQTLAETMTAQVASSFDAANGSWKEFKTSMEAMRLTTIARLMDDFGLSADAAEEMTDKLVGVSKDWKATFELSGQEEALTQIGLLQTAIDKLPEDVNIKVTNQIINGDYKGALQTIQDYYDKQNLQVKVDVVLGEIPKFLSSGLGLGVGFGEASATPTAAAAEAGPRFYAATPTATAPTVHVPVSSSRGTLTQNITISGILGDPYAVQQAVTDALRQANRVMPVLQ